MSLSSHTTPLPSSKWLSSLLVSGICATLILGCGDDDGTTEDASATDSTVDQTLFEDTAPDLSVDADIPDAPVVINVGEKPACVTNTLQEVFALGYGGSADDDPSSLVAVSDEGPWVFGTRRVEGTGATRVTQIEAFSVDSSATVTSDVLEETTGAQTRLQNVRMGRFDNGLLAVWTNSEVDAEGKLDSSALRKSSRGLDGTWQAPSSFEAQAAAPFLATNTRNAGWLLRSELRFGETATVVIPQLQRIDWMGESTGLLQELTSVIRIEATDLQLTPGDDDAVILTYRVPPSTLFTSALNDLGTPITTDRQVSNIPTLEKTAAYDERIASAWTELKGGMSTVGVIITDGKGNERTRVILENEAATLRPRASIVRAWPGFVAVWRKGLAADAELHVAGIDPEGVLVIPSQKLIDAPGAFGKLRLLTDGSALVAGYRVKPGDGTQSLGLTRICIPVAQ